jgi:hypothetical protein
MRLRIERLVSATLGRKRGREAYEALLAIDDGQSDLVISLDGSEAYSLSFLDEFLVRMNENHLLRRTTFETDSPLHIKKLGRASEIRNVTIRRSIDGRTEVVTPVPGPTLVETSSSGPPPEDIN